MPPTLQTVPRGRRIAKSRTIAVAEQPPMPESPMIEEALKGVKNADGTKNPTPLAPASLLSPVVDTNGVTLSSPVATDAKPWPVEPPTVPRTFVDLPQATHVAPAPVIAPTVPPTRLTAWQEEQAATPDAFQVPQASPALVVPTKPQPTQAIYKSTLLTFITYTVAILCALFSGAVATYGLTKLAPGAEYVVFILGLVYEAGKLTSFAVLHAVPLRLKLVLTLIGITLMALNIAGVSGFLSNAYERTQNEHTAHQAQIEVDPETLALLKTRLASDDAAIDAARAALIKARANKGRVEAAQAAVHSMEQTRHQDSEALEQALSKSHEAKASAVLAGSDFAAVQFLAAATQQTPATVTHLFILTLASIPDLLAVFLLISAPFTRRRVA